MAALHEAVLTGNLDCVKLLVKYGADIHQRDENGWTPLHMACSEIFTPAHEENVRFIYEAWQCVERDLRSQMGSERGLVEEYVEKMPNPSLKAFKPVDLGDLKRRSTQDAKKS
uniref:Uncharacterized protein n=1 Tax=Taeniopygia guttata TaxID=59729 RepID=A0A674GW38_TAEGU